MSIYSVPRFYIREIYRELFNNKTRQVLEKYGIRIVKLLEPELTNEKLRQERQIIGLERGSVGSYIREVIIDLYDLFQKEILYNFYNNIEDELNKYIDEYINKIRESIIINQFHDVVNAIRVYGRCLADWCYAREESYKCRGIIRKYKVCYGYSFKIFGGVVNLEENRRDGVSPKLNYTEFFAFLAPQMFSGLAYIEPVKSKDSQEFHCMCLLGWESV